MDLSPFPSTPACAFQFAMCRLHVLTETTGDESASMWNMEQLKCYCKQLGNLSEHARVKIAWARENCVALAGNLKIIINKDGGKLF